jgi:hypothetical protein
MSWKINGAEALASAARDLAQIPAASDRAAYRAVNKVAAKVQTQAKRTIVSQVMLTATYVGKRMDLVPATLDKPVAIIKARKRPTRLSTYGAKIVTVAAPGAKGDPLRKIPAGRKSAGVGVRVSRRGGWKILKGAFLMPLRSGREEGGNGLGVFIHPGAAAEATLRRASQRHEIYAGKGTSRGMKHLYGPSVDQLFRRIKDEISPTVQADLAEAFQKQLSYELGRS